jgi:hypothetical protein
MSDSVNLVDKARRADRLRGVMVCIGAHEQARSAPATGQGVAVFVLQMAE